MSGIDKITARLIDDTAAECEKISAKAEENYLLTIDAAYKEAAAKREKIISEANARAAIIAEKAQSQVRMDERSAMLEAKIGLINDVLAEAVRKLENLDSDSYFKVLARLVAKNRLSGDGELLLTQKDKNRLPDGFVEALGGGIALSPEALEADNGFVLRYGDIEVNCTFGAILNSVRDEVKTIAADILFA